MFFKDKKEYEEYLIKNRIEKDIVNAQKYFKWSEDGEILLEHSILSESAIDVEKYTNCKSWNILKDNETMLLVKIPFGDVYRDLNIDDYYITIYNNILLPQIANQFENKSAIYYIAKNNNRRMGKYIVTLDFKGKNEELIHGDDILEYTGEDESELNISKLLNSLEDYLVQHGYSSQDIERVKIDFVKQSFFNKFIKQYDENNHNWGILINNKTNSVKLAPIYDLDCSCDVNKKSKHMRSMDNGSFNSMEQFVMQYRNKKWFKSYIEEVIKKFNIEKAFMQSEVATNTKIPDKYKQRYRDFFALRFYELKQVYEKVYTKKEKNDIDRYDITK